MKNKAIIVSVLAILLILSFSNITVSRYIDSNLNGSTLSDNDVEGHSLLMMMNVSNIDSKNEEKFLMMLSDWSVAKRIQVIRREYSEAEEVIRYYVSDFKKYAEKLLINKEYLLDSSKYKIIKSENNHKIFKGNNTNFEILSMLNRDEDTSINNIYIVNANSDEIESFITNIKMKIKDADIKYEIVQVEKWRLFGDEMSEAIMALFACGLTLFVILNSYLLKEMKKVALMKIEGHGSLYILKYLCGDSIKYHLIALITGLFVLMFWFVPLTMLNAMLYYVVVAIYLLIYILGLVIYIVLLYLFIKNQEIVTFLKGKNTINKFIKYIQFNKIIVLVLSIWFMVSSVSFVYYYAKDLIYEKQKLEIYENLYMIVGVKGKYSNYFNTNVVGNESEIVEKLEVNSNLFFAQKSSILNVDTEDVIFVDENYLKRNNLWKDDYLDKNTMITYNQTELSDYVRSKYDVDIIEYRSNKMERVDSDLFGIRDFFSADPYYSKNSIFLYNGKDNEVKTMMYRNFYYDGNLEQARAYIKDVLRKFGFEDYPLIISATESYQNIKKNTIQNNMFPLSFSLALFALYACISVLIFNAYYQANSKKNMIMWAAGWSKFSLFKEIVIVNLVLLCLVEIGCKILFNINWIIALSIAFCFFVIELVGLAIYLRTLTFDKIRRHI